MASDIKFKQSSTWIIGGPTGSEGLHFVYDSCITLKPSVQSQVFQVELSGVTANSAVPHHQLIALKNVDSRGST
jgi:hypothetical protein